MDYDEYIQSSEWKEKDKEFVKEVGECESCHSTNFFELGSHHITYKNLGNETRADVQVLCWKCHIKIPHYNRKLNLPFKKERERFERDCYWREIIPTLSPTIKERFNVKEKPIEIITPQPKFKVKVRDWRKQVYYDKDKGRFKSYTFLGWLKKMVRVLKRISRPFKFKHLKDNIL